MENKVLTHLNAALILFLLMVIYTLVINFGGYQANIQMSWISYIIVIAGIMVLVIKYSKDMQGNVTFGNLFAYGFKTTAILIIFFIAFTILFYLVFPEYKLRVLEIMKENALKNATAENKEQAEKGVEIIQRFFWVSMIAGILISFAILGAVGSLLGAAFAKKSPRGINNDFNKIN